ncbi:MULTISPECIES: hypothetical protein [Clostridium]|uniref:hypothetical protein n=1 Tax=Clostridium TaxID=1485 RepID=UPI0012FD5E7E|nr:MULTISPECIES: hypothetical protein [Clostridium]
MDKRKFSLTLVVLCIGGALWVKKTAYIGYISTAIFLLAAGISLAAYFKEGKSCN